MAQQFETSASHRVYAWRAAVQMTREHPWRGVGFGEFPELAPHYSQGRIGYMDTHNTYLFISSQMGLPALAVFLLFLGVLGYYARWLYRHSRDLTLQALALGMLGGLVGLMVSNLFSTTINTEETTGQFWILAGLVMRGVLLERAARTAERSA